MSKKMIGKKPYDATTNTQEASKRNLALKNLIDLFLNWNSR